MHGRGLALHTIGDHLSADDDMIILPLLKKGTTEEGTGVFPEAVHQGEEAIHVVTLLGQGEAQGVTLVVTHLGQGERVYHLRQGEAQGGATHVAIHQGQGRVTREAALAVCQEAPVGVSPIPLRSVVDLLIVTRQEATREIVLPPDLDLFQNLPVQGLVHRLPDLNLFYCSIVE